MEGKSETMRRNNSDMLAVAAAQNVKERDYWLDRLAGKLEKVCFPYDYVDKRSDSRKKEINFEIPADLLPPLVRLCNNSDVRLHMILVTVVTIILKKYGGSSDILLAAPIYKQESRAGFINTVLTLRNHLEDENTIKELLLQVRANIVEAAENYGYPVELLPELLEITPGGSGFPLFDVAVLVENIHEPEYLQHIDINVIFSFKKTADRINGRVEYNGTLYAPARMEQIAKQVIHVLEKALENLDTPVGKLDIMTPDERKRLMMDINATGTDYPAHKTIHRLFEEQAENRPDAVALVFGDMHITYGRLNRNTNRLARHLRNKGVKNGDIVGLMTERSTHMIEGMMGILKTGGAYLPIDPEFPGTRVCAQLDDANAKHLITAADVAERHSYTAMQNLRANNENTLYTPRRPHIEKLDRLPIIDRSRVNYEKYNRYIGLAAVKHSMGLMTTRGCPYKCAYCHNIWPKKHVARSAENIYEEISGLFDIGVKRFIILDDIFNLDAKNCTRLFDKLIKNKLNIHMFFPNGLRGELLTGEFMDLMIEAGTVNISMSLETASKRLQKMIGKNMNIDKLWENLNYICEKHPQIILDVQTMHGFPTETEEEAMQTMNFLKSLKWIHFPYIHVVKIYQNTEMEKIALENGISKEMIEAAEKGAYHQLSDTLPFDKRFTLWYQSEMLKNYFLSKERLLDVLPHQMKLLDEDELVQKYESYLGTELRNLDGLLKLAGITPEELGTVECLPEDEMIVPELNTKLREVFPYTEPDADGLRILLVDLSTHFSHLKDIFYNMVEPPLGPMSILTYLTHRYGGKINGKILQARLDFDNYEQLKEQLDQFKPDVIGLRTLTYGRDFFHQTAAVIRSYKKDIPIIAGGPYATSDTEFLLQDRNIDLAVMGEGEITFSDLIGTMLTNNGKMPGEEVLKKIPGLAYRKDAVRGRSDTRRDSLMAREIIILDMMEEKSQQQEEQNLTAAGAPVAPAYTIFTSGSTGKPKGTLTTHKNVVRVVRDTNYIDLTNRDRVMQFSNFAFDGSVFDIYGALLNGGTLVMTTREDASELSRLPSFVNRKNVTVFFVTTALFNALVDIDPEGLKHVRKILFGGERVSVEHVEKALEVLGPGRIIHMYGPTETTVYATFHPVDRIDKRLGTIAIGKPLANTTVYILNRQMEPVPAGVAGELYIGGDSVCLGYLNKPEMTGQYFKTNPHNPGETLYSSGDLVRWTADADIEFMGRIDRQVKVRGFRVEIGEIEKILSKHRDIKEAVVLDKKENTGEISLCAYIVLNTETEELAPGIDDIKEFMAEFLPDFMIPAYFMKVNEIPLNPNGKVDRKALPEPGIRNNNGNVAPMDETEKGMLTIWAEVLGIPEEKINITDDFFELGGHSLKATVLSARIHKAIKVKVPLADIFRYPTVQALAQFVGQMRREQFDGIELAEEREYYNLSSAQKRMYVLQQVQPGSMAYNMPQLVPLNFHIPGEQLKTILTQLVKRHESFRTSFEEQNGEPYQRIHPEANVEIQRHHIESPGEENEKKIPQKIREIFQAFIKPFQLNKCPLLRLGVIEIENRYPLLMVDTHHIISDGVSQAIVLEDFKKLIRNEELPPLRIQYKDYARWQKQQIQSDEITPMEDYWLKQFEGEIPELNLPRDYNRQQQTVADSATVELELSSEISQRLNKLARSEGATLYMVMLAACTILLGKLSGQEDVVVGTPVAGRKHADLQKIVGMFVNSLALRNYPAGEKTFLEYLREVKTQTLAAFENQDYPFELLVEKLPVIRQAARNPLFDVMFTRVEAQTGGEESEDRGTNMEENSPEHTDYEIRELGGQDNYAAKFDLTVAVGEIGNRIRTNFSYNRELFRGETVKRFARYYGKILDIVGNEPQTAISNIEPVWGDERKRLLMEYNQTETPYPGDKTLHRLFEEQAAAVPHRAAVIGRIGGRTGTEKDFSQNDSPTITYAELNRKAGELSYRLSKRGVGLDTIVALRTGRTIEMIIGIFGILKAGAAYMPIDPEYPEERIRYMLEDSATRLMVTVRGEDTAESAGNAAASIVETLYMDVRNPGESHTGIPGEPSPEEPGVGNHTSNQLCYVIYTSGSTGRPKGTLTTHKNAVRVVKTTNYIDIVRDDRVLQLSNYAFDGSVFDIFGALLNGAGLVLLKTAKEGGLDKLPDIVQRESVTVFFVTTALFNVQVDIGIRQLKGVRKILFGGERVSVEHTRKALTHLGKDRIIHMYGPTETTVYATYYPVDHIPGDALTIPIGRPLANTTLYVMDKHMKLVPRGVTGELYLGGDGVCRGYMNNPELTAERFVQNPYLPGERLYRSGDLVRMLPEGDIQFIGRSDRQLKVRGYRVEIGEIERKLLKHPQVKEAVVVERKEISGEMSMVAYIVPETTGVNEAVKMTELREYLAGDLPKFMIPAFFVSLEKLPLTANGKLDRNALPEPEPESDAAAATAPRDEVEARLVDLWADALGIPAEQVGIDTDFFEAGGHSLKTTLLVARIHKALNIKIPISDIFRYPTVRELAPGIRKMLTPNEAQSPDNAFISIRPAEKKEYYSLSSAQKRLYIVQQRNLESVAYNMPFTSPVDGGIDVERLENTFRKMMERHESLRTTFRIIYGSVRQQIHDAAAVPFEIVSCRCGEAEARQRVKQFVRPFDLSQPPLIRVQLIKLDQQPGILQVDMHHIISDGISQGILVKDFIALYDGKELSPLRLQYKDYSEWQNRWGQSRELVKQEDYWLRMYSDNVPQLNIPTDNTRPPYMSFDGDIETFRIEKKLTEKIETVVTDYEATLHIVLLAAYNVLLARYSGQQDIVVGTTAAGRTHADLQGIIGVFVNMLAIRNKPLQGMAFSEFLQQVKTNALKAYENQDYPFDTLVERLDINVMPNRQPLVETVFGMHRADKTEENNEPGENHRKNQEPETPQNDDWTQSNVSKFDLKLLAYKREGELHFLFEYRSNLFEKQTIQRMSRHYINILESVTENTGQKIKEIEMMSADEEQEILRGIRNETEPTGKPGEKEVEQDEFEGEFDF
jgi:amino acid adenylation domain-containing protein